jgi:DNA polymerase-3 subunit gamma/tau
MPSPPEQPPPAASAGPAAQPGVPNEPSAAALARDQIRPTRGRTTPQEAPPEDDPDYDPYDELVDGGDELPAHELLTKHLGAELIGEEDDNGA